MAGWNHDKANWKNKTCIECGSSFKPKSGVHKFCSESCKGKNKYTTGVMTTTSQYKIISGNWARYFSRLINTHKRKSDGLTREILLELLAKQNYRCAISGLPLECKLEVGVKNIYNASIDRVEAGKSYSVDNIQLVCRALNSWRSDTDLQKFIEICRAVADFNKAD